jgi:PAS domain S-box-containing protein
MATATTGVQDPGERLQLLEAMLDAITDYEIIKLDLEGNIASWSRGAEAVTGYSGSEVIGRPVSMFYTDEDVAAGLVQRELRAAASTGRYELEGWRLRKGGERFWAGVIISPIRNRDGQVTGYVKVAQDLTERRRAESMTRDLLEASPDPTVIVNQDGRIELVNQRTEQVFGYRREDLIGQEVEMLVPPRLRDRHPVLRNAFFADARARPMGVGLELFAVRSDGTEFPVEISLSPIETFRGTFVSAAIRDVTERHGQMQLLRRQRDEILELSTPVIEVWESVLALPIIGTLDSNRAARLTESLLEKIGEKQCEVVILDISGVPTIDTLVAQHLLRTIQAATLMGTISILSGIRPETAQAMVHLGIDLGQLRSRATLRHALQLALHILEARAGPGGSGVDGRSAYNDGEEQ